MDAPAYSMSGARKAADFIPRTIQRFPRVTAALIVVLMVLVIVFMVKFYRQKETFYGHHGHGIRNVQSSTMGGTMGDVTPYGSTRAYSASADGPHHEHLVGASSLDAACGMEEMQAGAAVGLSELDLKLAGY